MKPATDRREEWLMKLSERLRPDMALLGGLKVPWVTIKVVPAYSLGHAVGMCWPEHQLIKIADSITDPVQVAALLVHELIHAGLPSGAAHGWAFKLASQKLGQTGDQYYDITPRLLAWVQPHLKALGPYPAGPIVEHMPDWHPDDVEPQLPLKPIAIVLGWLFSFLLVPTGHNIFWTIFPGAIFTLIGSLAFPDLRAVDDPDRIKRVWIYQLLIYALPLLPIVWFVFIGWKTVYCGLVDPSASCNPDPEIAHPEMVLFFFICGCYLLTLPFAASINAGVPGSAETQLGNLKIKTPPLLYKMQQAFAAPLVDAGILNSSRVVLSKDRPADLGRALAVLEKAAYAARALKGLPVEDRYGHLVPLPFLPYHGFVIDQHDDGSGLLTVQVAYDFGTWLPTDHYRSLPRKLFNPVPTFDHAMLRVAFTKWIKVRPSAIGEVPIINGLDGPYWPDEWK